MAPRALIENQIYGILQAENTMHVGVPNAWYFPVKVKRPVVLSTRNPVMTSLF